MARGKKTGGRQLGATNKATSTLQAQVEEEAGAPLPVLLTRIGLKAMKAGEDQLAVNALSKAAGFTYARIAAIDPDSGSPATLTVSHRWGSSETPVVYPPLVVNEDGMVRLPENWPGQVIRFHPSIVGKDQPPDSDTGPDPPNERRIRLKFR